MRSFFMVAASLIALATSAQSAPLDAYGELPTLENVAISPSGDRLAYIGEKDGKHFVVIEELTGQLLEALDMADRKVRNVQWGDETHVVVTWSDTAAPLHRWQREVFIGLVFNLADKTEHALSHAFYAGFSEYPEFRVIDGRAYSFVKQFWGTNGLTTRTGGDIVKSELGTGLYTLVSHEGAYVDDAILDQNGRTAAVSNYESSSGHWSLLLFKGHDVTGTEIYSEDTLLDPPGLVGISPDGTALQINSHKTGEPKMLAFSLSDGHPVPSTLNPRGFRVVDRTTGLIAGQKFIEHDVSYRFFDPRDQAKWDKVAAHFPNELVELKSASDDRNKMIVHVTGREHGDVYEFVDVTSGKVLLVGPANRRILPDDVARVSQFVYAAADGRQIDAYLTLPTGRAPEHLPLIVMPHDGPDDRDQPGFDWWAQAMAAQGYAVLQPEFRGSIDLGWDVFQAGFGQFGRKMQTDLSDGVRALARAGIVDPKRACIMGTGYGGYAALAGATIDTGVYRCAVSVGGISDPARMAKYSKRYEYTRYWMRFMGVTDDGDPSLDAIAPLKHAARATIPVMLVYGDHDSVVPTAQSKDMADALQSAGKPCTVVVLEGEDHWLSRSETRLQMLKATVEFVRANNPP